MKPNIIKNSFFAAPLLMLCSCVFAQPTIVIDRVDKSFSNITSIEVEGAFCSVTVTPGGNDVLLSGEIKADEQRDDIKIKYAEANNTLKVWIEHPNSFNNIDGRLELKVPATTNINVVNSSGSINVTGITNAVVSLKAGSGSIAADQINTDLTCQTSSGSQKLNNVSGNLTTSSSSGSQRIYNIGGRVETTASSGSVRIEGVGSNTTATTSSGSLSVTSAKGNVWAKATSGSIQVTDVKGDLTATSSSGSIQIDNVSGTLATISSSGSQSGNNITLTGNSSFTSTSGSINMQLNNNAADLSFDLTASSGSLNAKGTQGSKSLMVDRGGIRVTGRSSSGSQNYR